MQACKQHGLVVECKCVCVERDRCSELRMGEYSCVCLAGSSERFYKHGNKRYNQLSKCRLYKTDDLFFFLVVVVVVILVRRFAYCFTSLWLNNKQRIICITDEEKRALALHKHPFKICILLI